MPKFRFHQRDINYLNKLLLFQTGMRCVDCGYSCHEKCAEGVPKNCTKYKAVTDGNLTTQTLTRSGGDSGSVTSSKCYALLVVIHDRFVMGTF